MSEVSEQNFKIVSFQPNRWLVETSFTYEELEENTLLDRVRLIKEAVSKETNVPTALLIYQNIVKRKNTDNGMTVTLEIVREKVEGGRIKINTENLTTKDGIILEDMKSYIDLYMVDPFDNVYTFQHIKDEINKAKIDSNLIDFTGLGKAFRSVQVTHEPKLKVLLAEGIVPDIGEPAEVEFTFQADQVESKMNKLMGATKVFEGDLLCSATRPRTGEKGGKNVIGNEIPPLSGTPVELIANDGANVSLDGGSCFADRDGIAAFERSSLQRRDAIGIERTIIQVKIGVEPIRIVDGSTVTELTTNEHVEIRGALKEGAKIIAKGNVFIDGAMGKGATVRSQQNLMVTGEIEGSNLDTDGSLFAEGDVKSSVLKTKGILELKGHVSDSELAGQVVKVSEISHSTVNAEQKVEINRVTRDPNSPNQRRTKVSVGAKEFLEKKMEDDREFIENAQKNLEKILHLIGPDLTAMIGDKPARLILLQFIAQEKKRGRKPFTMQELDAIKTLIESIEPLGEIIKLKEQSINTFKRRMEKAGSGKSVVIFKEKVQANVDVSMAEQKKTIASGEGPVRITFNEDADAAVPNVEKIE